MTSFLAHFNGDDLLGAVVRLVIAGAIVWVLLWLVDYLALPQPFNKVAKVIIALTAVVFLVHFLLGLSDRQITFR